jgi:hypothetical protein
MSPLYNLPVAWPFLRMDLRFPSRRIADALVMLRRVNARTYCEGRRTDVAATR